MSDNNQVNSTIINDTFNYSCFPNNTSIFGNNANGTLIADNISILEQFNRSEVVSNINNKINKSRSEFVDTGLNSLEKEKGIILTHQNLRSINNKFAEVQIRLTGSSIDVHSFSETWLHKDIADSEIYIPGYSIIRTDRNTNKTGGGVCLYYKNNRTVRTLVSLSTNDYEVLFVELKLDRCKSNLIGIIYKPPNGKSDNLIEIIESILNEHMANKEVIIMGDFNIDASQENMSNWKKLYRSLSCLKLTQIISEPTRIGKNNETLIDHIWTNNTTLFNKSGVVRLGLSDHDLIYTVRKKPPFEKVENTSFS